jgi:hypothetical protein
MKNFKTVEILGALAVSAMTLVIFIMLPSLDLPSPREITDWDRQAISMIGEMNKFLIALSTLLIAGLSALVFQKGSLSLGFGAVRFLFCLSYYCCCLSLYWGFVVYGRSLEMIEAQTFDSASPGIQGPQMIQYYTLLSGFLFFAIVILIYPMRALPQVDSRTGETTPHEGGI